MAWAFANSAKSGSSGSLSRAHVVAANSHDGNGHSTADAGVTVRVGASGIHDVDGSKAEGHGARQETRHRGDLEFPENVHPAGDV